MNLDELFPIVKLGPDLPTHRVEWLIDGLWQRGKINAVAGYVKSGKSRLLSWLLTGVIGRKPVLGLTTHPLNRVLYLAGEESADIINERLLQYMKVQGIDNKVLEQIDLINASGMRLDFPKYRQWLEQKLPKYDLVIIDPLRRVHGANENDNTEMARINNELRRWTNQLGHTFVFIHHTPKPPRDDSLDLNRLENWLRGAGDLAAIIDTAIFVEKQAKGLIKLRREGRYAPLPSLEIVDKGHNPDQGFSL